MAIINGVSNLIGSGTTFAISTKSVRQELELYPDQLKFVSTDGVTKKQIELTSSGHFSNIPRQYDAIVDISGEHDFTSVAAAFKAGNKKVFVLPGTYVEDTKIKIPDRGCIVSPSPGSVYIVLSGNARVEADSGHPSEETGTISITNGTKAVTGVGTTFTNLSSGKYIKLRNRWYAISTVTDDTNLTILETYYGFDLTNTDAWSGRSMYTGIFLSNLVITGGTGVGFYMRGCRRSQINHSAFDGCVGNNFEFRQCATMGMENVVVSNSESNGLFIRSCSGISINSGSFENNAENGIEILGTTDDLVISSSIFTSNGKNGMKVGGETEHLLISSSIFVNNNLKGLATTGFNVKQCTVDDCTAEDNGGTGFDFDGDNSTVVGCIVRGNGIHGIAAGNSGLISSNQVVNNSNRGIHIPTSKNNMVVVCNTCEGNGAQGIRCQGDNVLVANNNCTNNNVGIELTSDAANCILEGNSATGNTGLEIIDAGVDTIVRDNIGLFDKPRSRFQSVKTSNQQDIGGVTPTAITFDANDYISSDFSHTSGNADITINSTGTYLVSFNIFYDGDNNRKNIETAVYVNGVSQDATTTASYTRNNTDDKGCNSLPAFELSLSATEVVTVRAAGTGSIGVANTELNRCWVRIERTS